MITIFWEFNKKNATGSFQVEGSGQNEDLISTPKASSETMSESSLTGVGRKWQTPTNLHYEIINELYENALPIEGVEYPFVTMVRGKMVPFDRNAINDYLGRPLTIEEGEIDAFSKRIHRGNWNIGRISQSLLTRGRTVVTNASGLPIKFKKEYMTTRAPVALTLMLYNIRPRSHTSTVPVEISYLLYFLVESKEVDVSKIIANEIKTIIESGTKQGSNPKCPLAFPGLITGLCKKHKIHIPTQVHDLIWMKIKY